LPEGERFELTVIVPPVILGPNIVKTEFTSGELVKIMMSEKLPGNPRIHLAVVDVRDVALSHVKAI